MIEDITIWHWLAFTAIVIMAVFFEIADEDSVRIHGVPALIASAVIFGTILSLIFSALVLTIL